MNCDDGEIDYLVYSLEEFSDGCARGETSFQTGKFLSSSGVSTS